MQHYRFKSYIAVLAALLVLLAGNCAQALTVGMANITPSTGAFLVTGGFEGLNLETATSIRVEVGTYSEELDLAAFRKGKRVWKYGSKTPAGIRKMTISPALGTFTVTGRGVDFSALTNPVRIALHVGGAYDCSSAEFMIKRKLWKFRIVSGTQNACGTSATITVSGRVVFDTGEPVPTAAIEGTVLTPPLMQQMREQYIASLPDPNAKPFIRKPAFRFELPPAARILGGTTNPDGTYQFQIEVPILPSKVTAVARYQQAPGSPELYNAKTGEATGLQLSMPDIVLPNLAGAQIPLTNGAGQNSDGSVRVEGMPSEVSQLYARGYDPDANRAVFPGDFSEMGSIPLNSSGFLWAEALDAAGNPVDRMSTAAVTFRFKVPRSQWPDLEDINAGTDRIEIPIYSFNEQTNVWVQEGEIGWLEDSNRTVLPEEAQPVILDGTFQGDIFATYRISHLSWMNVDYAYIGPWTLSRMSRDKRNVDCLYNAMQLAKTIARSAKGRAAYAKVNAPGGDIAVELADGNGPELHDSVLNDAYGEYRGDAGGSETQFELGTWLWDLCGATEAAKKNAVFTMAVTILHETAHWKDDVKKSPTTDDDTPGEEGDQLEKDLFGGGITIENGQVKKDGVAVTDADLNNWMDTANWPETAPNVVAKVSDAAQPPMHEVTISVNGTTFDLGQEVPVTVQMRNTSSAPIPLMNHAVLEGYPLYFNIVNQATGQRVKFLGSEKKLNLQDADFTAVAPGDSLVFAVNLVRDPVTSAPLYAIHRSGTYSITAVYETRRGVPEAVSNTIQVDMRPGGRLFGNVTNAVTGQALGNALVKVMEGANVFATTRSSSAGQYDFPELPPGNYSVEASSPGMLNATRPATILSGGSSQVDFSLSPLMVAGQLRMVLTWGTLPSDLDSHLWLPAATPYHVFYGNRGSATACPFAELDVDDTSGEGPETITITRMFPGIYNYAIYNYSGSPSITTSQAQVQVFDSTGLKTTVNIPATGEGRTWRVLTFDGSTGSVTVINEVGDFDPPYIETTSGCIDAGTLQ